MFLEEMMRKRTSVLAMSVVATVALAGCSAGGGDTTDDGPVELVVQRPGLVEIPADNVIEENLESTLGIDLQLSAVSATEYYAQLSASMAGGNAPDLFVVDRARLDQFVAQGQILDVSEYVAGDQLADYRAAVGDTSLPLAEIDGKTYALPARPTVNYNSYWIRQDWLDNLGLDMPETVDEFLDVATAFAQDDPDGSGAADTYGLTGGKSGSMWTPLWDAFGSAGLSSYGGNGGTFSVQDGDVVNSLSDPNTEDALGYIRELIDAGAVDPDYLSIEELAAHERAMQGSAGILFNQWTVMTKPEFIEQYQAVNPDAEWVQVGPLSGPGGDGALPFDEVRVDMWAISAAVASEPTKLAKILELLNYVSTEEGDRLTSYGIEGEHYEVTDGAVVGTELLTTEGGYFWIYQFSGRDEEEYLAAKFPGQQQYIDFAAAFPLLPTHNSLVIAPETYMVADAGAFAQENIVGFVSGTRPLSDYDGFIDQLDELYGQQEYVDSAVEQLEAAGVTD
jgi:putative aldouronate transport system substrate-binding protein